MKRIVSFIFIIAAVLSCQKEDGTGKVEVEAEVVYLPAEGGIRHIFVDSTTEWRLEYDTSTSWMSTDLHGGKSNRKYFTVSFQENPTASPRSCEIEVFTSDGNDTKTIILTQKRRPSYLNFSMDELVVECWAGTYSADITDNIISNTGVKVTTDSDWITLYPYSEGNTAVEFYIDRLPSVVEVNRIGHIYISCEVEDEGMVGDVLVVKQLAKKTE